MVAGAGPKVESLDIIQLGTPDVAGTTAFYLNVMGATVVDPPSAHWARVRLGNIDLGIHARAAADPQSGGWEPGFRVSDIAAYRAHLLTQGVSITKDFHDIPGGVTLSFQDNGGNSIGVYQYGTSEAALRR